MMRREQELRQLVSEFLESYSAKKGMKLRCWLIMELHRHMQEKSAHEIVSSADEIIKSLKMFDENRKSVEQSAERGMSTDKWFERNFSGVWDFRSEALTNSITQYGIITAGDFLSGDRDIIKMEILSGDDFGLKAALSGAELTAANRGMIDVPEAVTPAVCAGNAYTAVENAKTLHEVSRKQLTPDRAVHRIESVCVSVAAGIASLKGAYEGVIMGWNLGSALGFGAGAAGAAIGGVVGGVAGWFAGSETGEALTKGFQKLQPYLGRLSGDEAKEKPPVLTEQAESPANT